MARLLKKNFIQSASSRTHEIMQAIITKGHKVRYAREALYPVLEAKTLMRERSRDQLGDIESIILKIVGEGVGLPDDIAKLLGFKLTKIYPILAELEGRGLILSKKELSITSYVTTILGGLSLEQGSAVFEVERSVLICGLTGRLLSYEMYELPRISTNKVSRALFGREFIDGAPKIPLSALSMSSIQDKRKFNLPDEIIEIIGVIDTRPFFLEGVLVIYTDQTKKEFAELGFGRGIIDWLTPQQVLPIIEPLGYSSRMTENQVLESIETELREMGALISGNISIDTFLSPCVNIERVDYPFYNFQYGNRPLAMYMGTSNHPSIPIGRFPFPPKKKSDVENQTLKKQDILFGRTMLITAVGEKLKQHIDMLRSADQILNDYSALPQIEKKRIKMKAYLLDQLNKLNIDVDNIRLILEQIPDTKLLKVLGSAPTEIKVDNSIIDLVDELVVGNIDLR